MVPTLVADDALAQCLQALAGQSWRDFDTVIVDNSARQAVNRNPAVAAAAGACGAKVLECPVNVGFGAAINLGGRDPAGEFIAALNDDAVPDREWLAALVEGMLTSSRTGMCASSVRIAGSGTLDSAGMLLAGDGSSKQRGHGQPASQFAEGGPVLFPSGSAALYRRQMLDEVGWFDESFFLYCEDTDLGLRARWAGWDCRYVPQAIVEHRYSHSSGRASGLKAYYVERNRLAVIAKNFPVRMLVWAPFHTVARYFWHAAAMVSGKGAAGEFRREGSNPLQLVWYAVKAHLALLWNLGRLLRERRKIFARARLTPAQFCELAAQHSISTREVASQ